MGCGVGDPPNAKTIKKIKKILAVQCTVQSAIISKSRTAYINQFSRTRCTSRILYSVPFLLCVKISFLPDEHFFEDDILNLYITVLFVSVPTVLNILSIYCLTLQWNFKIASTEN